MHAVPYEGIFANCGRQGCCGSGDCPLDGPGCTRAVTHTDFFAMRPEAVRPDAFSCWNTSSTGGIPFDARPDEAFRPDPSGPCAAFSEGAAAHAEEQARHLIITSS